MPEVMRDWKWWFLILVFPALFFLAWLNGEFDDEPSGDCYADESGYYCDEPEDEPFDRNF